MLSGVFSQFEIISKSNFSQVVSSLKDGLKDYSLEAVKAATIQANLTEKQAKAIFIAKGLKGEQLEQAISTATLSASQKKATASTLGLGKAFKGLGVQIKAVGSFLIANPIILAITAVAGLAIAYNKLHTSVDEAKESLDEINSKTESLKSEMSSLESQITENAKAISRLEELASRAELTATEKEELETLKLTSAELELQKQLIQDKTDLQKTSAKNALVELEKAREESNKISTAWEDWLSKVYEVYKYVIAVINPLPKIFDGLSSAFGEDSTLGKFFNNASDFFGGKTLTEKTLEVDFDAPSKKKTLSEYEKYANERNKLLSENPNGSDWSDEEKSRFEEVEKEYSKYRESLIQDYEDINESLKYYTDANEGANGAYDDRIRLLEAEKSKYAEILGYVDETVSKQEKIDKILGSNNTQQTPNTGFNIIPLDGDTTAQISEYEKWLNSLDDETINEIRIAINEGSIQQTEEDVRKFVKNLEEQNGDIDITPNFSVSGIINQLDTQLKPTFDSLQSAYQKIFTVEDGKEIFTLENVDISMFKDIQSSIEELNKAGLNIDLSSYNDFVKTLADSSSTATEVQSAFNNVATTVTNSLNPSLSQASGEQYLLIQSMLESLGIMNSEEVMISTLGYSYTEYVAAKEEAVQAGKDLSNYTEEQISGFVMERIESGKCGKALANLQLKKLLVNSTQINVNSDIQQILALANAAGITSDSLVKVLYIRFVL